MTYSSSGTAYGHDTALDNWTSCALLALLDAGEPAIQGERLLDVGTRLGTVAAAAAERGYRAAPPTAPRWQPS